MMNRKHLLVTAGLVLLIGLVVLLPARVLHRYLSPDTVQLAGIEGSAWHGRAAEAMVGGAYLRNLSWSLRPLSLLTGRVGYALEAEPAGGFLETDIAVSFLGNVSIDRLRAALPLTALGGIVPLDDVEGQVTLQVEDVRLEDGWPRRLSGQAGVAGLLVRAMAAQPLGDFRAEFQTGDDGIVGSVEDVSGMLDVAATLTLSPDRSYALIGQVGATPAAPQSVVQQLRFLGTPDARGLREFRLEGSL